MLGVIDLLEQQGLTSISEGALVVDLTAEKMPPLLLRKTDGTTLYATRDLATGKIYRFETFGFTWSLYVVDKGQSLHWQAALHGARAGRLPLGKPAGACPVRVVRIGGQEDRDAPGQRRAAQGRARGGQQRACRSSSP